MKSRIIGIISSLSVLGLGIFAVVQMNGARRDLSIIALAVSLIPMYFLYAAVVLGKYNDKNYVDLSPRERLERVMQSNKNYNDNKYINKVANDYGKVLDFPTDKKKKSNKNK